MHLLTLDTKFQISWRKNLAYLQTQFQYFQESGEQQEHLKRDLKMSTFLLLVFFISGLVFFFLVVD